MKNRWDETDMSLRLPSMTLVRNKVDDCEQISSHKQQVLSDLVPQLQGCGGRLIDLFIFVEIMILLEGLRQPDPLIIEVRDTSNATATV